ncbi:MAG TPA: phosphomannomutase [Gammaproteobacteria bacterium]
MKMNQAASAVTAEDNSLHEIFKAYDVRGRVPETLDEPIAFRIGWAFARYLDAKRLVIGGDVRDSSERLMRAVALGMEAAGAEVSSIGLCGTEEIYFATFHYGFDGGLMVTASHNPLGWNGMKFVGENARPLSGDEGLGEVRDLCADAPEPDLDAEPSIRRVAHRDALVEHLLSYVDVARLKPLKLVANPGNGTAGPLMEALCARLPFELVKVHFEPDAAFPNGIPNPLLPENRAATANAVRESNADFGIAWDGDFDRCFLFDENGEFIEGYYMVGLLAEAMLRRCPGENIVCEPRLTWNTLEMVKNAGGQCVQTKAGHAFIKATMRRENAIYGGEMSAHHYFRDFAYCDSGMIPWLLIAALVSESGKPLSALVSERIAAFPCSGEINRTVADADAVIAAVEKAYVPKAVRVERLDGLGVEFDDWRFNLRKSNTEPLLRLNVESRGDRDLVERQTAALLRLIEEAGSVQ